MTLICVSKLTIIGSDNGLSPGRRQAIIWTSDGILLIGPPVKFNQNSCIFIKENPVLNVIWEMATIFLGLNVLRFNPTYLLFQTSGI